MLYLIVMTLSSLCAVVSFYMVWIILGVPDKQGVWLFLAFGCFFFIPVLMAVIEALSRYFSPLRREDSSLNRGLFCTRKMQPAFVSHWKLMTMIIVAIIAVLAAILKTIFIR
ncbi:MAG: hypothetical protein PHP85_06540 [Gallionella sp.]|nr:hypothetical protein [Gallionella sp.]